ncbi:MAG: hypothetical protein IPL52_03755 [Flavobacteriales bacterium]|nr:hypothetical protein [Flavobacteriales bacterium]
MGARGLAQTTGTLRVFCEPSGSCQYILDGKHRLNDREITLLEGPHRFVFWAPERRMLDTMFMVTGGQLHEARVQLHYSQEFIEFSRQADSHRRRDRWLRYGTPVLTVGAGAWAGVSIAQALKARKDLDALADDYATLSDPGAITALKDQRIPDANSALRRTRTMAYVSSGVFVLSAGAYWYAQKVRRANKAPLFEDKEKVRFDGLVWVPGATGGTWAMAATIPIR